ncbi:MAG: hypothetical protein FWG98_15610 [Candidatus Cloacimonetes bacterium]|nr:hypothetical protein [Candidatus Cloacimonadota bacterium]
MRWLCRKRHPHLDFHAVGIEPKRFENIIGYIKYSPTFLKCSSASTRLVSASAQLYGRETELCEYLNNKIFAKNDTEFWDIYFPPNHYNCRSTVISLPSSELNNRNVENGFDCIKKSGLEKKKSALVSGFGCTPKNSLDKVLENKSNALKIATLSLSINKKIEKIILKYKNDPTAISGYAIEEQ